MQAGFEVIVPADGKTEFRLFSPETASLLIATFAEDKTAKVAVALMGRLFYRHELHSRLEQATFQDFPSDAALALAIFLKYGVQGLTQLEGEFAMVVFDQVQRCLFTIRDPLGSWPLYWTVADSTLKVSTSLLSLAQNLATPSINLDFLASFLMMPHAFVELHSEQTAFQQIQRILPGTILAISPEGRAKQVFNWDWLSQVPDFGDINLEDASSQFAYLFQQAVKQRIERGKIAAHLSGGIDSSSVVCVARDLFASGLSPNSLSTLSLVYQMPSLATEKDYIQMVLDRGSAIDHYYLNGDSALDFQWFTQSVPHHDEPYAGLFRLALEKLLVETAQNLGATTILTGVGVDELIDGNRLYIADLLQQGKWIAALNQAQHWAYAGNTSLWSSLYNFGIEPILPPRLHQGFGTWLRGGYGQWPHLGLFAIPPWVLPEFAHSYKMREKGLETIFKMYAQPIEQSSFLWAIQTSIGNWSSWYLAAPHQIQTSHPFLDPRLITFCLALPREIRQIPGVKKPVLQAAMREVLPEPIRTRRWKRSFNQVYWLGLSQNLSHLEDMVWNSSISDLGIFDKQKLLQAMRQHTIGIGSVMAGGRINSSLALVAWFDQIQENLRNSSIVFNEPGR